MLRSLSTGVSGLQQFQQQMDVIGNNISNVNTTAYKGSQTNFADAFSVSLQGQASSSMQVGTGVTTGEITNTFSQGTLTETGAPSHLAIDGNGFFVVRNTITDEQFLTRDGTFHTDKEGYLITASGMRVQGFSEAGVTPDVVGAARGDVRIDLTGAPAPVDPLVTQGISKYSIDDTGKITARLNDGREFVRGQVLMHNVRDPQVLEKAGDNLYSGFQSAGLVTADPSVAGTAGLGSIKSGKLETSNVDLAAQFSAMIRTQRAFQASARIISTSDEFLQELVNLKR
ncbi:MAG: flagellar hook-basal body complex protein [Limisphaerales bacterium]